MKTYLRSFSLMAILSLFYSQILFSQAFTEQATSLPGIDRGSVDWGDYDNDGDPDVLITGSGSALIYRNDAGSFVDIVAGLQGVYGSSAKWGDYDRDGDLDIILNGEALGYYWSIIYRNDNGVFVNINAGLTGISYGSSAWGDYDNDGDLDILITGMSAGNPISIVYRNDNGVFTDIHTGLPGLSSSSCAWGDYDNDGDLDVILSGYNDNSGYMGKIFRNDNGIFNDASVGLIGALNGSVAWGDYDNDGDLDILLTGANWGSGGYITKLYRNNSGTFTEINAGLTGVGERSSAAWGDYDNDGDLDIVLSGQSGTAVSKVYRNDAGVFTDISAGLTGLSNASAAWGDYDKDGDLDILLAGNSITKLYLNNSATANSVPSSPAGLGSSFSGGVVTLSWNKSSDSQTPQNGLSYNLYIGTAAGTVNKCSPMASVPGGVRKVVRTGSIQSNTWSVKKLQGGITYYWSVQAIDNCFAGSPFAAEGSFSVPFSNSIAPIADQKVSINQNFATLAVTESSTPSSRQWKYSTTNGGPYNQTIAGATGSTCSASFSAPGVYYVVCESTFGGTIYTSNQVKIFVTNFLEQASITLPGINYGSSAWGDYDNDGDLDILISGWSYSGRIARIYRNNGDNTFTGFDAGLTGVSESSAAWGDYNNDGYLDIILTGNSDSGPISKVYRSKGTDTFQEMVTLTGIFDGSASWGDYDNDGDLDILLCGNTASGPKAIIYRNDGANSFTEINAGLTGGRLCSADWGDYDNDGDLDILYSGYNDLTYGFSKIYRNDNGFFTDINVTLPANSNASVAWGDYDNDGDLDILLKNWNNLVIYNNDGGSFSQIGTSFPSPTTGSTAWGDYDNDGDLDFLFSGTMAEGQITKIYQNNNGAFSEILSYIEGYNQGQASWGDYDNDGDLDILLTGNTSSGFASKVYKNNNAVSNTTPSAPSNLVSNITENGVLLTWNKSSDAQTLQNGLSYNLYIGGIVGGIGVISPMAEVPGGYRRIVRKGTVQGNSWSVKGLPIGMYYWSVQAIDNAFAGSSFGTEESFTIPFTVSISPDAEQTLLINTDGTQLSAEEFLIPETRQWKYSTTPGGPYDQVISGATGINYTPNFSSFGTYYVVCQDEYDALTYNSNEVKINVPYFTETGISLAGVRNSSVAWGDYDNDGDQDILATGGSSSEGYTSKIYQNTGGNFTDISAGLTGVENGSASWGDYDNDGDLDILLTGNSNLGPASIIYQNTAGTFADISAGLTGVSGGSTAWGDYDNDGDLDILLTGWTGSSSVSKIYRNTGGTFTDINAGLAGINDGSAVWGDYDNDGDLDILLAGSSISRIYRNDAGTFTDLNAGLYPVYYGSAAWIDYDNDGDLDVSLSGSSISKIYQNNGGTFTDIDAGLPGLYDGTSIAWGDYDNDGDPDLLLTGRSGSSLVISKIFRNDNGTFSELNAGLTGVQNGSAAWGDYDGDGDLDILLTGSYVSKVYRNNSTVANTVPVTPSNLDAIMAPGGGITLSWNKTTDLQTPQNGLSYNIYIGTSAGSVDTKPPMAVVPGGYRKISEKGLIQGNSWTVKGLGADTYYWSVQAIDNTFAGSAFATEANFNIQFSISIAPVAEQTLGIDEDGTTLDATESNTPTSRQWKYSTVSGGPYDQVISGATGTSYTPNFPAFGTYYVVCEAVYNTVTYTSNEVKINVLVFSEQTGISLPGVDRGSAAWGDYDNDGDKDLIITGYSQAGYISKIYNNNAGVFTDIDAGLPGLGDGTAAAWGDYDNDGDLDLLISGFSGTGRITEIYKNDGGTFTDINAGLIDVQNSALAWGDYDNDGDLDILLTGYTGTSNVSRIYRNDAGVFTDINAGLPGINYGSVSWGDYDADGDLDILLAGSWISEIYRNDGGNFVDINAGFFTFWRGSAVWGDYDNDGDLDIAMAGAGSTKIYQNNSGTFSEIGSGLTALYEGCSLAWGDYDNDGDLDIILTGYNSTLGNLSKVFSNDAGVFADIGAGLAGVNNCFTAWCDYDNDNDLDIFITGNTGSVLVSKIYRNAVATANSVPLTPANLQSSVTGTTATLSWDKTTDGQTPQNGLSYNLYIGASAGAIDKKSPMAELPGGYRKIVQKGDIQGNSWKIKNLSTGTYYWSVQAIDNAFAGSAFTSEGSFNIPFSSSISPASEQNLIINQDGVQLTVTETPEAASRQWKYSTVSGGPYNQTIPGATGTTYTPNFSSWGTYYVICESVYDAVTYTSNEVKINVLIFSEQTGINLTDISDGKALWGDYDNDGDLDILITGYSVSGNVTKLYKNNSGNFEEISADLANVQSSAAEWGDYDNDNDLDLVLTGYVGGSNYISKIYRNDAGVFIDINASLTGVQNGSVSWGDYDNDGDLDLLLTGNSVTGDISKIYRNEAGTFTDIGANIVAVSYSSSAWGDYDNDGDLDILLGGGWNSRIYRNDNGIFSDINAGLNGLWDCSVAWGDYDNDGDLDIAQAGTNDTKIYRNSDGSFSSVATLPYLSNGCTVAWADYDNDGDLDLFLAGYFGSSTYYSRIYRNDAGTFTDIDAGLTGVYQSSASWGDYDNDGDLDLLITGYNGVSNFSRIYRNNITTPNSAPTSPSNLQATPGGTGVTLSWNKATDSQTLQNGLSYNLYIGTSTGTVNKRSPMASIPGGVRKIAQKGLIQGNSWTIKKLGADTYYWSVQAIDNTMAGSAFPTEGTFTIPFANSISPASEQILGINETGTTLTVSESSTPSSRQWKYSTVSGGPYNQSIAGATGFTYTPVFQNFGNYYVVCEAVYNAVTYTSNEVKISLPAFLEQTGIILTGVNNSSAVWGDYDSDGDLDILLTGSSTSGDISKIYRNDAGLFTDINAGLTGAGNGSSATWGDYDNDGDLDILLAGSYYNSGWIYATKIYQNNAGVFTDIGAGLAGVSESSVSWGDYDNDGDLDILMSGYTGSGRIVRIYRNDSGIFTDINATLPVVENGSVLWGDLDNDGDLDMLLTGGPSSKIYRNNNGVFTDINANLPYMWDSWASLGDFDNDGDLDILMTGNNSSLIFRNDNGIFTDIGVGLSGTSSGSAAWGDYDNDGDLDVLLTGSTGSSGYVAKVYKNESGVFSEIYSGMTGVISGSVAWGDYDNDGDLDILLTGNSTSSGYISKVYKNTAIEKNTVPQSPSNLVAEITGSGVTLSWDEPTDTQTPTEGLSYNLYIGTAAGTPDRMPAMAQIPGGYRKIVNRGLIQTNSFHIKRLEEGTYYWSVQAVDHSFAGSAFPAEGSFDVPFSNSITPVTEQTLTINQTGDALTVTESGTPASRQWKYSTVSGGPYDQAISGATGTVYAPTFSSLGTFYVVCESVFSGVAYTSNEVKVNVLLFSELTGLSLTGVSHSSVVWGDYDNDGDPDILLTGSSSTGNISKIYNNDAGVFTDINAGLAGVYYGSCAWGDYDNDNDLDILLTGSNISKIYRNDAGAFNDIGAGLTGVSNSSVAWGDYDNDGDLDILLTGSNISKIYRNEAGVFTDIAAGLNGIQSGSVSWGDYDNDGDLDILMTGQGSSIIYRNDKGIFINANANLAGVWNSSSAWGDYDNDGDLDVLLAGDSNSRIYRNDNGTFTDINAGLTVIYNSSVSWGDYDNDGDLDILMSGYSSSSGYVTKIYRNDAGIFTDINAGLTGMRYCSVAWGDYDNDNDIDILLTGSSATSSYNAKIYKNNITTKNTSPQAPSGLQSNVATTGITLTWNKATDSQTLQNGLSYNVYVGTSSGAVNKRSPMASLPGGYRRVIQKGAIQGNSWVIKKLGKGDYWWSVQAIDNAFAGSPFATEGTFNIPFTSSVSPVADQSIGINQDGTELTVTEDPAASSRQWKYSTTSGGPYSQVITGATATSYTPNFSGFGTYYVICESVYNTVSYPSNEVKINVVAFSEYASLPGVPKNSVSWGDYDNDGDLDILITGGSVSKVFRNNAGVFSDIGAALAGVSNGFSAWGDYDNDGDLDILITGGYTAEIYMNDSGIFTDIDAELDGIDNGSAAWGDYDNDGDLDILLAGSGLTKIYRNDSGVFTDIEAGLYGIYTGMAAWGDYDKDGDLDILLSGNNNSRVYRNVNNTFTDISAGLTGANYSSVAWGDYDNDGDLDILLTGSYNSKIYRNDNGLFNDIAAGLTGVSYGSAVWGDCDNDGDLDILLAGMESGGTYISKVYRNDDGVFTELTADLPGVRYASTAWGDFDKDGDLDILFSGRNNAGTYITKIYINNYTNVNSAPTAPSNLAAGFGSDRVTLSWDKSTDTQTPQNGLSYNLYIGTSAGSVNILSPMSEIPGGLRKIAQKGSIQDNSWFIKGLPVNTYYWSVQAVDNTFTGSAFATEGSFTVPFTISIAPVDDQVIATNQNFAVLSATESSTPDSRQWKYSTVTGGPYSQSITGATEATCSSSFSDLGTYYVICESVKDGISFISNEVKIIVADFTEQTGTGLTGTLYGSAVWGDYDNDDDLDLLITGNSSAKVYRNDSGVFTDIVAGLTGVSNSSGAWGDFDNDGDLDILLTGDAGTGPVSIIYRNDNDVFNDISAGLAGIYSGTGIWGDYDNDGDLDVLITGRTQTGNLSKIYRNDAGVFTDINTGIPGYQDCAAAWGDYDNDGDLDILIAGYNVYSGVSAIYRNDRGVFTNINAGLPDIQYGSAAWGDYDSDGDLDILLTGAVSSSYFSGVYRNDGGVFVNIDAGLPGVRWGSASWGDYDNDGDLDILLTGYSASGLLSGIYRNDLGTFTDIAAGFTGIYRGSSAWGDFDNDGDLDVLLSASGLIKLYRNLITSPNTPPAAPSNLISNVTGSGVTLTWNKATDAKTAQDGLSYNIYIGTSSGTVNKRSPMAVLPGGLRKIVQAGNIQGNSWTIRSLPFGTYYWSVQAIDNSFAGSAFAIQGSFTVAFSSSVTPVGEQVIAVNQSASMLTVTESGAPTSRQWKYSSVSGGPYDHVITGATGTTCSPSFSSTGTYYVVCEAVKSGVTYTSNQVRIIVSNFIVQSGINLPGVEYSSAAWGDYDNDGDLDLLITGSNTQDGNISRIYRNDSGVFTDIGAGLTGVYQGSVAWGDYDNDGDLDIMITGHTGYSSLYISKIYKNDAGIFTDINAGLTGVYRSSAVWGDYDNDGDLDVLLSGTTASDGNICRVYRNDNGIFRDINAGLIGTYNGSVAWVDYDNDGDADILTAGSGGSNIYRNDGAIFTNIAAGLPNLSYGSVAWGDFDSDGDPDFIMAGGNFTKLFRNDNGVFNELGVSIPGVNYSSSAWGDYDNDGDLDILLTGLTPSGNISKIFLNNGGLFSESLTSFENVIYGASVCGDYDSDGDLDILIAGRSYNGIITKIYKNCSVNPNEVPSSPSNLKAVLFPNKVLFTWDKSNDSKTDQPGLSYNLYIGDASGTGNRRTSMSSIPSGYRRIVQRGDQADSSYIKGLPAGDYYWSVQAIDNSFTGSPFATEEGFTVPYSNSVSPADGQTLVINQNGTLLTVTESADPDSRQWKYSTTGGGPYTQTITGATGTTYTPTFSNWGTYYVVCESVKDGVAYISNEVRIDVLLFSGQTGIHITGVYASSAAWGDYDNDGDLDIIISGSSGSGSISKIYRNDEGVFTDINAGLPGISNGTVAWGDYDNDNDLDLIIAGSNSRIYRNDNGIFTDINAGLPYMYSASVAWGDYDNDGDLDLVITGNYTSIIYQNNNGIFTDIYAGITGIELGSVAWGDYDNDDDLDILLTGWTSAGDYISKIYRNDSGIFKDINAGLPGVWYSSAAWGDYDSDGDLDILLTGLASTDRISKVFRNDNGIFPEVNAGLIGVAASNASWGDYDNDGDLDILLTGSSLSGLVSKIYRNDAGVFTDINAGLTGVQQGSVSWGDYDNDNDLDILLTGSPDLYGYISMIYRNNITTPNALPSSPTGLASSITGKGIALSWNKSTDSKTPQSGISYNLYIGTSAGTVGKKSPMSSLTNGYRRISQKGAIQKNSWLIRQLPVGTYYWSVQATDNSFAGSPFATEGTFSVLFTISIGPVADQILSINQNGTTLTVNESGTPVSRQWKYSNVSGGPYNQSIAGATGTSCTPVFAAFGTYYIVCESVYNSVTYTSNEVKIRIPVFSEQTGITLTGVNSGSMVWGDYDNDGDKDLLFTGGNYAKVYSNNSGLFNDIDAGLTGVSYSSAAWGDYDNDGDLDIIISGYISTSTASFDITSIYRNDAGVFTDINAGLTGVQRGSVSWGDYDNDGDLDILLTGSNLSKIYRNDAGVFTDTNTPLTGVTYSSAAWGDYDNDGDLDILLTGLVSPNPVSEIYRNDNGSFTEINAGLTGVSYSSASWGDYDNDGDLDILLSGKGPGSVQVSLIYRNDAGVFTDINAGLPGLLRSSAIWGDYDNDGDLDIFMSGNCNGDGYSGIYRNNSGVFVSIDEGITGVEYSSAGWCDYDNDGDIDLVISGNSSSGSGITKIYRNNTLSANLIPSAPSNLQANVTTGKVTLSWNKSTDSTTPQNGLAYNLYIGSSAGSVNRMSPMSSLPDGYRRIVQKGLQGNSWWIRNLTAGTYYWSVQSVDNAFAGSAFASEGSFTITYSNSIAPVADQDLTSGQTGTQLAVSESSPADSRQWKYSTASGGPYDHDLTGETGTTYTPSFSTPGSYYIVCVSTKDAIAYTSNEVRVNILTFIEQTGINLIGIIYGTSSWCDYDNDGDLDLLLSGYNPSGPVTTLYRNDGGAFISINAGLTAGRYGSSAWGDYDNDGYMDLLLTGYIGSYNYFSKIYHNNAGVFTDINAGLPGVNNGSCSWGDYDNDGDLDILLTGNTGSTSPITRIYRNDEGLFTDINAGLPGVFYGCGTWGDYDNDGDKDILLTGTSYIVSPTGNTTIYLSKIYRNDNGTFTDINAGITGAGYSNAAWGDYDNDGDLDFVLTGYYLPSGSTTVTYISKIYRNDSGIFTDIDAGLINIYNGTVSWGDYDNDGDLDILLTGNPGSGGITKVYRNDSGLFTDIGEMFPLLALSSSSWGDYDNDGDLDFVLWGYIGSYYYSKIFRNFTYNVNTPPSAPVNLKASGLAIDKVTLSWDKPSDAQTPQNTLTYNIRVGTTAGGCEIVSPLASAANGYRRIPARGNADLINTGYSLGNLATGTYYWSVQAVDQAFAGGTWSDESTFTLMAAPVAIDATGIKQTTLNANWNASAGATGYRLDVATDISFTTFVPDYEDKDAGNVTTAEVSGLTANTTYYYRLRAYDSGGTSLISSNIISATTLVEPPAAPVANAATAVTQTSFTANWSSSATATGYNIDVAMDNQFASFVTGFNDLDAGDVTSYDVTNLTANTTYYYRVRAYSDVGTGGNSDTISVTTLPVPPAAPTNISFTGVTATGLTVNWQSSATATGYRIDVSTDNTFATFTGSYNDFDAGNVTSLAISGLSAHTTYYFRIRAYNTGGTGVNSSVSSTLTYYGIPPSPVAADADNVVQTGFKAKWARSPADEGYYLDVATDAVFTSLLTGYDNLNVGNDTSYTITGLTAKTIYYYRVRAYNASGTSGNSNTIAVTTLPNPPAAPTGLAATSCNDLVTLTWTAGTESDFQKYLIYEGTAANPTTKIDSTATISSTTKTLSGLTHGQTYYFRIKVVVSPGVESEYSSSVSVLVKTGVIPRIKSKFHGAVLICYNIGDSISSWQWYRGTTALAGATKQYYATGGTKDSYRVLTTDKDGCQNYSNIINTSETKSVSLYPNPAEDSFTLKYSSEYIGRTMITLYNSSGVKVLEYQTEKPDEELKCEIPVGNLPDGVYSVKIVINEEEVIYSRVMVIN